MSNLDDLKKLIDDDVILVSISEVNSEIGLVQNVLEIGKMLKEYILKVLFIGRIFFLFPCLLSFNSLVSIWDDGY